MNPLNKDLEKDDFNDDDFKGLDLEKDSLYDSNQDENDEEWITKKFSQGRKTGKEGENSSIKKKRSARNNVLSCPGCFTMLCLDSQQHERYKEQYRAMFVENCRVDEETLQDEVYHPVYCQVCQTQVGVCDEDKVYHFFHVLVGY
ncbi:hypothetical protein BB559_000767 [Furculomyces boomerangus]|uniref:E2F-associated phosphoprotein n=1 Tax=Furculomyces boomerangus TaxID=61424 RepID=A0A2T9Z425_9FUNG|nr:hypothetical protein BB559_000767 [Furculomyces boomerangus]